MFAFHPTHATCDTVFHLTIGNSECPLTFHERLDSTVVAAGKLIHTDEATIERIREKNWKHTFVPGTIDTACEFDPKTMQNCIRVVKDTILRKRSLEGKKWNEITEYVSTRKPLRIDTIMQINPMTQGEEQVIIPFYNMDVAQDMGDINFDAFLNQIKSGFSIQNSKQTFRISMMELFYQSNDTSGFLALKYPNPESSMIEKLFSLCNGGFVVVLAIITGGDAITETIVPYCYISINSPSARPIKK